MSIVQLAKILQLAGFLLASIFGGILLDKAVGGKIAEWAISLYQSLENSVKRSRNPNS